MQVLKYCQNKKGVTLIELLASLVLLSIVIMSFLSFFSQSMMFSVRVEDKLTAINLAEKVLSEVKDDPDYNYEDPQLHSINGKIYTSRVYKLTDPPTGQDLVPEYLGLIPVKVEIDDEQGKLITEIYGYKE